MYKILFFWSLTVLILSIFMGGFFTYGLMISNHSLQWAISRMWSQESSMKVFLESEVWSRIRYYNMLITPWDLHYIWLWGIPQWLTTPIITDSFDFIRFVNTTPDAITLDIYDNKEMRGDSLLHSTLSGSDLLIFPLKQSGIYWYKTETTQWEIIVGKDALADHAVSTYLDDEIFPMIHKDQPDSLKWTLLHFKDSINTNGQISRQCHNLGHEIGHRAFELFGFTTSISYAGTDVCAGGYTHGILESYFLSDASLEKDPERACKSIKWSKQWSCFHGVGHGLMFIHADDVNTSLEWCRKLSENTWHNRCAEGVFMELYSGDLQHAWGQAKYSIDALFDPCTSSASGSEWYVCGFYAWLGYLRYHDEDYDGALRACEAGWAYTTMCVRWIGREIAKRYIGDSLKLEKLCTSLKDDEKGRDCIKWGINYTSLQYEDDVKFMTRYCIGLENPVGICENIIAKKYILRDPTSSSWWLLPE